MKLKNFLLQISTKVAVVAGAFAFALAVAFWHQGIQDSRAVTIKAEELGKIKAGDSYSYPTDRVDYDLELRVFGQDDAWVRKYINVARGDLVEVRLRIASVDEMSYDASGMSVLLRSPALKEFGLKASSYESPDPRHITYVPVGVYEIDFDYGSWPHDIGACTLGIFYDRVDNETDYAEVYLVPPHSELSNKAVLYSALVGLICLMLVAPATGYLRYRFG